MADKANKAIENNKPVLLAHPALFDQRHDKKGVNIGGPLSIDQIKDYFEICLTDQPRWLTKNLVFLGEIPRLTPFESKMPLGYRISDKEKIPDMLQDDTGLAFISDEGLVIISGCAHSGICNTIIHAENVTGITRLAEVVGGLHLMNAPEKLVQGTMQFLTEQNPKNMHPCHCTDLASKIELAAELPIREMGTGMQLIY